jgi:enolase-phosphatase E1
MCHGAVPRSHNVQEASPSQHCATTIRIQANSFFAPQYPSALTTLSALLETSDSFPPPSIAGYVSAFPADTTSSSEAFLSHIQHLTATDSKASALKALQGFLWRTGFESGALQAPLFPDVPPALKAWRAAGLTLAIFSSGSVAAQKLFLAYTGVEGAGAEKRPAEDLNALFAGNFDTVNAGPKGERRSYKTIAEALAVNEKEVLFLSDNVTGQCFYAGVGLGVLVLICL